jgi:hypothetical protein
LLGKVLSRLLIVVLIGISVWLYLQVVSLQQTNRRLETQIAEGASVRAENRALRDELARRVSAPEESPGEWIASARAHVQLAEAATKKGNFGEALRQTQFANLALSRAADQASASSRGAVQSLRARLQQVDEKAHGLWKGFGG